MAEQRSLTIFEKASGEGTCAVVVIRVSGPNAGSALRTLAGLETLEPSKAVWTSIEHPLTKVVLDKGLVLWFPAPNTFTGEDYCEFHVTGAPVVVNAVLNALSILPDMQPAGPDEFTRRALVNGKLDLIKAEGLTDLMKAQTELQRQQAFLQSQGSLSNLYIKWRDVVQTWLFRFVEYGRHYEHENIESHVINHAIFEMEQLLNEMIEHVSVGRKGDLLKQGVKTVIFGEKGVGKSSLFNLLCQRSSGILTPIEGTTSDASDVTLDVDGYPIVLADTAGVLYYCVDIANERVEKAIECFDKADLVLLVVNAPTCIDWLLNNPLKSILDYLNEYIDLLNLYNLNIGEDNNFFGTNCIVILNKYDLVKSSLEIRNENVVRLSCATTDGVDVLMEYISARLKEFVGKPTEDHPSMTQDRHKINIFKCLSNVHKVVQYSKLGQHPMYMMECCFEALFHFGQLLGYNMTEQMWRQSLHEMFRE